MSVQIKFGSYDMTELVEEWQEISSTRIYTDYIPRRHGSRIDAGKLDNKEIYIKGAIVDTTQTGLNDQFDELKSAVNSGKQNLYLYNTRYIVAQKKDFQYRFFAGRGMLQVEFEVTFIADTPFWFSSGQSSNFWVVNTSPYLFGTSPSGNAIVYPKWTFSANQGNDINTLELYNLTVNKYFEYLGTVAEGQELVIDCENFICKNNGIPDLSNFQGDFWEMIVGQMNNFKYIGDNCQITQEFKTRWW